MNLRWWAFSRRRSLSRRVDHELDQLGSRHSPRHRLRLDPALLWPMLSTPLSLLVVLLLPACIAVILGAVALECPISFPASFVSDLWLVDAAILGFSVAVVIYAFQALARQGGLPDDLALASSFPAVVNVGLASILLMGGAQAAAWHGAGWLALFGVALSCAWFLLLVQAFREATRVATPQYRVGLRLRRLLGLAESHARSQVRRAVAARLLDEEVARSGSTNSPWLFPSPDDDENRIVRAAKQGRLADVDMVRLRQALDACKTEGQSVQFCLRYDHPIAAGAPIALVDGPAPATVADLINGALTFEQVGRTHTVAVEVERLRNEALVSMGPTTEVLDEVLSTYEEVLVAFGAAWRDYVDEVRIEQVDELFDLNTPVKAISRSLFDLMERALVMDARESARSIAYFPMRILRRAVELRAPAFTKFLDLYVSFYALTSRASAHDDVGASSETAVGDT